MDEMQSIILHGLQFIVKKDSKNVELVSPEAVSLLKYFPCVFDDALELPYSLKFMDLRYNVSRGDVVIYDDSIAIRSYKRGGLVRYVFEDRFWLMRSCLCCFLKESISTLLIFTRPYRELKILSNLFAAGISIPRPLGISVSFSSNGFYRGRIATSYINDSINLMDLDRKEPTYVLESAKRAGIEVSKMLDIGVFHTDFHPGNVILDKEGKIVILDLDKARLFSSSFARVIYERMLVNRWIKSVKKYKLAEGLIVGFKDGLHRHRWC